MSQPIPQPMSRRARILIVDDQAVNIRALHELFRSDHEVFMATSGEQALVQCQQHMPDLILLDVMMPDLSGHDVCRRLKADPVTQAIPIIFITGQTEEQDEVLGLELGAADFITKPFNPVVVLARVRIQLTLKFQSDLLRTSALTDELTGVANRRKFDEELQLHWRQCQRVQEPLSLILVDVDHFKRYNDHYGHLLGDVCLRRIGQTLRQTLHRPFDTLARYGGEEFVCLLPQTDEEGARAVAQMLLNAVAGLQMEHEGLGQGRQVSISLGVATWEPPQVLTPQALVEQADQYLYAAKRAGRGRVGHAGSAV